MSLSVSVKHYIQSHSTINSLVMYIYMRLFHPLYIWRISKNRGIIPSFQDETITIYKKNSAVRISRSHAIYAKDIVDNYDFYFSAVFPIILRGVELVDYSTPRFHEVVGYEAHPVYFPSLAEPIVTTDQYLEFAQLGEGAVALDLGAYSGLTSILMREKCGSTGRVVAVDADENNLRAIRKNFALYQKLTGKKIDLLEAAVWVHSKGIAFSSEGSMGSSATDFVGDRLGVARTVPSVTLSELANRYGLAKIDFIKCDIEGAEAVVFDDPDFFENRRPRIIAEIHPVKGEMTSIPLERILARYGYRCTEVAQPGSNLPLLECVPDSF